MDGVLEQPTVHKPAGTDLSSVASLGGRVPFLTIRPTSGWAALNLREVWQFRDLLWSLAGRDVKLRYRQTALGVIWVVAQPLMAATIFAFVFGKVAKLSSEGVPYIVFSYAGLLAWNAFSNTLQKSSTCLVTNAHLVSKVFFPRLVLPLSTVLSTLIDFAVALVMLVVLLVAYRIAPGWEILLLPVWLLLTLALAMGLGLVAAALTVSYRDVQFVLPVLLQFALYASPVAYAQSQVPEKYRFAFQLNPLTGLLEAFRWSSMGRGDLHPGAVTYSAAVAVGVFVWGLFAFKRMERRFADII